MENKIISKEEMKRLESKLKKTKKIRKVLFKNYQSPGDIVMLSSSIRDLKLSHPEIEIGLDCSCKEIFDNNPYIVPFGTMKKGDPGVEFFEIEYPLIHNSNEGQYHFIHGFRQNMEKQLGVKIGPTRIVDGDKGKKWEIPCRKFKGDIHLSDEEKSWMSQIEEMGIYDKFWILNSGTKSDFNAKMLNPLYIQEVINYFKGKITFVQIGEKEKGHFHPPIEGTINLIGKTNLRQLIRLVYHSIGILSGVTLVMHLAQAVESKHGLHTRPAVIVAGGREGATWEKYCDHMYLSRIIKDCAPYSGCWKSRVTKVNDGDSKDNLDEFCLNPQPIDFKYFNGETLNIAKCINIIKPYDIIRAIESYYEGGVLEYGSSLTPELLKKINK